MKKILLSFFTLVLYLSAAMGQTPVITMTSQQTIGTKVTISLQALADNTPVQVDFGDGILIDKMFGTTFDTITRALVGTQPIKIYGTDISWLGCVNSQISALDVTKAPSLVAILCDVNLLTSLDVSKNTALLMLICDGNQLTSLDISKNTELSYLECQSNQISALDVSKNASLEHLICQANLISSLDVSNNPGLIDLECNNNQLTSLKLNQNAVLSNLTCDNNLLKTLDLSGSPIIDSISCKNNQLTFASLPLKQAGYLYYYYAPQGAITLDKSSAIGLETDLNNQFSIDGNNTVYTWKTKGGTTLVEGTDYTISNGKTTFIKEQSDSVYCELANASFPNLTGADILKTTFTKIILPNPTLAIISNQSITSSFTFSLKANSSKSIVVDFGDGMLVNKQIGSSSTIITGTLAGSQTVKVYGSDITSLSVTDSQVTTMDLSNCLTLSSLTCYKNQFTSLDLSMNTALAYLNCDSDQLTTLDVSKNIALTSLLCASNHLSTIDLSKNTLLTSVVCKDNQFNFATLPIKEIGWTTYTYAPEAAISIVKSVTANVNIDLSNQLIIDGHSTVYTWKTLGGTTLVAGTDYNITAGKTTFLKGQTDSVYCSMSNAAFPDFDTNGALKTSNVKVDISTGVKNLQSEKATIYAYDKMIYINTPNGGQVSVFDNSGRLVISKVINSGLNSFELQKVGVYTVKVSVNKEVVIEKVFIK